jgi:Fur family ferric uptake transcriptional regulator
MKREMIDNLLGLHEIKATPNRILVASALAASDRPLSLTELEDVLPSIDKSAIFRTLSLFRERHLVHAFEDGSDVVRYELCFSEGEDDSDMHVHFYCESCHRTFCLHEIPIPKVDIPEGYKVVTANYIVRGVCPECMKKQSALGLKA